MKNIENTLANQLTAQLATKGLFLGLEEIEVIKNSIPCTGLRIIQPGQETICPVVYYSQEDTIEAIAARIEEATQAIAPAFDLSNLYSADFFKRNAHLALSRRNGESQDVITKPYLNMDLIIKVLIQDNVSDGVASTVKLTNDLLKAIGLSKEDAFGIAEANTRATVSIVPMTQMLGIIDENCPLQILSTDNMRDGAIGIYYPDLLGDYCSGNGIDELFIIPSSTQEMIIIDAAGQNPEDLLEINAQVNAIEVDPLIRLDSAIYRYSLADNVVNIAAIR